MQQYHFKINDLPEAKDIVISVSAYNLPEALRKAKMKYDVAALINDWPTKKVRFSEVTISGDIVRG